jgi:hypothetical protein
MNEHDDESGELSEKRGRALTVPCSFFNDVGAG